VGSLTYEAALAELRERGRFGIRLGLGRTRALLHELGDPQAAFKGALIGGTNGKGSVLALVSSVLRAAGLRAGETPKPHLVTYRERLQIAGRLVDPTAFARLVEAVLPAADRVARRHGQPTEFELLTAVAYRWFADQAVDLAIVEVGLGGRLDATHAWDGGVAAITNVDHAIASDIPAKTSLTKWTPRYARLKPTSAIIAIPPAIAAPLTCRRVDNTQPMTNP